MPRRPARIAVRRRQKAGSAVRAEAATCRPQRPGPATNPAPDDQLLEEEPGRFETAEEAVAEDRIRVKGLRMAMPLDGPMTWTNMGPRLRLLKQRVPHLRSPKVDREAAICLIEKLEEGLSSGFPPQTLASSLAMRVVRKTVIGAMVTALEGYLDKELRTFTIINQHWLHTPETLDGVTADAIKKQFRTHLDRAGVTKIPGPFIAILHGEFEPTSGTFQLHFHGITTVEKAAALDGLKKRPDGEERHWGYERTGTGAAPIVRKRVNDRPRQFSYPLKSYWPKKGVRDVNGEPKRDRSPSRIPEPFHSQVLLWLDRQRLRDLVLLNDCWSPRNGGPEAMRGLFLSVMGRW